MNQSTDARSSGGNAAAVNGNGNGSRRTRLVVGVIAVFAILGMTIAVLTTFLLPETAGRELISLADLDR